MGTVCAYFSVTNLSVDRFGWLRGIEALTAEFINDEQQGQPDAGPGLRRDRLAQELRDG